MFLFSAKLSSIEEEDESDEVNGSSNPLIDLSQRFEQEKEELLQMLKGNEERFVYLKKINISNEFIKFV